MANWWDGIVPATKPRENEKLWEVLKGHDIYACELNYRGEYGVEAQIFKNAETPSRLSASDAGALAVPWAED